MGEALRDHGPVVCFTCGAPAHKVIYLPQGCAALPDAKGIVGICPQHETTIEPLAPYHVLCDFDIAMRGIR